LNDNRSVSLHCFPDVASTAWYAEDVCRAKALGLVRGNAVAGVSSSLWRFEPARDIQYEEAVKILVELYELPISGDTEGMDWYVPYINAAQNRDVDISGLRAGDRITRGEMARLAIAFVAWSEDRLDELRDAETMSSSSSSRSSSSRSSSSSSRSSSSSSRSSSSSSVVAETVRSHILVLGTTTPTLASVDFFSDSEPVDIDEVTVTFASPVQSIGSLLLYNGSGAQIGTATSVGGSTTQFRASIAHGNLLLPYRQENSLSVRARLKSEDTGGVSGEEVRVQTITATGVGRWSSEDYTVSSTDTFPESETAFATITDITNAGANEGIVVSGANRILADFIVHADTPESLHQVELGTLRFEIEQAGGVTLSNVSLQTEGNAASSPCVVSGGAVTCSSIDTDVGTVEDTLRLRLIGDVSVPGGATNPTLRLVINEPGTTTNDGDITWSDGTTTFTWIDLDQPAFGGTTWR
jgi:hypothetical protein